VKIHDLKPSPGSNRERKRVGRGIAGKGGKTAGRGTKGQKARAGGSIPPWFEGGQTPLHVRIPKLRGFKNRFKIEYEVVNVGAIAAAVDRGAFDAEAPAKPKGKGKAETQLTINQDVLRAVGLVRKLDKPLKILGGGELDASLFVVADAFTASARTKIEAAGGTVQVLEVPTRPTKAIGVEPEDDAPTERPSRGRKAAASADADAPADEPETAAPADEQAADAPAAEASTDENETAAPTDTETEAAEATSDEAATESGDDA
jgi:large subunit ribosomal protein L15